MRTLKTLVAFLAISAALSGCSRIENGEVGLRQKFDKTFEMQELQPGSLNQTLIGSVLTFKVQEVPAEVKDLHPQAADNSALGDFDAQVIYSLNPSSVAELWTKESKSFHTSDEHGDVLLMNAYLKTTLRNAAYKAVRTYTSDVLNDNRGNVEKAIKAEIEASLVGRGLGSAISISQVQVTSMTPAQSILDSANALVKAGNELKQKTVEVQTAGKEAERIAVLNSNAKAIDYMNAQSLSMIAQGVRDGRVHSVVVPYDFKGIVNTGSK